MKKGLMEVIKNYAAYQKTARKYSEINHSEDDPLIRKRVREIFMQHLPGKDILEIGAGYGIDSYHFKQAGNKVTATDFSDEFVKIIKEKYPELKSEKMDMTNPIYPGRSFDGIYCYSSFLHIPPELADDTVYKLSLLLKTCGIILIHTYASARQGKHVIQDWCEIPDNPVSVFSYPMEDLKSLLTKNGFKDIETFRLQLADSTYNKNDTIRKKYQELGFSVFQIIGKKY